MFKKVLGLGLPVFAALAMLSACNSSSGGKPVSIKLIHTNDHHSHLDSDTYDLTLDGVATRLTLGGVSRLAIVIDRERDGNSILLNSGELNGTLYYTMFKGEVDFKVFNALGLDGYTLGNHEFDEGDEGLARLMETADFPILSSNMAPEPASPLYRVREKIKPYVIKEIDGQEIGIMGILKAEKTRKSSLVSEDVTFTDEMETLGKYVAELEDRGIDKIILVSHVGYYNDIVIAKNVPGIDVIVGGDSHSLLGDADALRAIGLSPLYEVQTGPFDGYTHDTVAEEDLGAYPTTVTAPDGAPVRIVQAWFGAHGVGILNLYFDGDGITTRAEGHLVMPVDGPYLRKDAQGNQVEVTGEAKAKLLETIEASPLLTVAPEDPAMEAILAPYRQEIEAAMGSPIGTISETLGADRIPAPFLEGETPTGSFTAHVVAQAFRQANPRIDVAIENAGGVRSILVQGEFTLGDALELLPYSNTVVMLDMTGAEIRKVLNESAWYALDGAVSGAFPYGAGLRYDVHLSGTENRVITNIEAQDRQTGEWSPLDDTGTYTVATNSFIALGRDNYLTFKKVRESDPARFEDTYIAYHLPFKTYLEGLPGQVLPPLDRTTYCLRSVKP